MVADSAVPNPSPQMSVAEPSGAVPALEVVDLRKTYSNGVEALKGVSLKVAKGDFFALLGPNGAGKSTLIGILSSLVNPTAGDARVFGLSIHADRGGVMHQIGLVPQEINFNQFESPFDICVNVAGFYGIPRALAKPRAEKYLKALRIWDKAFQPTRMMSGGMKRRLMIARAMMNEPRLLILDEPTAGVGISVDTATDIAKESADIILLEKNLMVLEEGVIEGRITFGNIMKYIKMTASSNFGNVFSVLVASAFLPFLPMLPLQILVQNLLYDISQLSIPFDRLDEEYLRRPRKWDASDIGRFMAWIGPISSIFDITTFWLMWHVFGANSPAHQSLFQSGWFIEGLLSQTLIVHMIRTRRIPFLQSMASAPVLALTAAIITLGLVIPFTAIGAKLGMVPLPPAYFGWLVLTLVSYSVLTQLVKRLYMRRYGSWL